MTQQIYDLAGLPQAFKKICADVKKKQIKALQLVLQLNKTAKFDEILVREGYQAYAKKQKLQSKKQFTPFQQFFAYMKDNLTSIQSDYLKDTNDKQLINDAKSSKNQAQYNYLLNKNSVSKFVRDQAGHYQNILDKYLQNHAQQEKGVKTLNIHKFMIDLFKHKCTTVIKDGQTYFDKDAAQILIDIGQSLIQFGEQNKEMSNQQAKSQFFINEDQMLDYLTFWLKKNQNLYVLYARTQERINIQSAFLTNKSAGPGKIHPSGLTPQEIVKIQQQEKEDLKKSTIGEVVVQHQQQLVQSKILQSRIQFKPQESHQLQNNLSKNLSVQIDNHQKLVKQLKNLFDFGCKRKYQVNKNSTFDYISQQSKTMDIDKFMSFCKYFQLQTIISRELIVEYFKVYALNRLVLDQKSFQKIIMKIADLDLRIIDHLLNKLKFDIKGKKHDMKKYMKNENKQSKYKFMLHPINGKDITTIQKELEFKRLQKILQKQQKQLKALATRQKKQKQQKLPSRGMKRILSTNMGVKLSPFELQTIRDNNFDPQRLIVAKDHDRLWQAYQAKIWKKQQKTSSALETILSKRMQRGKSVLSKINSELSFLHS